MVSINIPDALLEKTNVGGQFEFKILNVHCLYTYTYCFDTITGS